MCVPSKPEQNIMFTFSVNFLFSEVSFLTTAQFDPGLQFQGSSTLKQTTHQHPQILHHAQIPQQVPSSRNSN